MKNKSGKYMENQNTVWIFHGATGRFSSGVFTTVHKAEEWIKKWKLTGVLTKYPIDIGVYDWAIESKIFNVKKEEHFQPDFVQKFTSASQEHYHYENGNKDDI